MRLTKEQEEGLEELSTTFGASQAQLVRWAVEAFLEKVRRNGGRVTLPFRLDDPPLTLAEEPESAVEMPPRRAVKYPKGQRKKGT